MAMVKMKDLLDHAYQNRYAIGAFEIVSLDFLQAVMDAAEQARSPVILNIVETHFELFDVEALMAAVISAAERATVPVCVQLDHCTTDESVINGIRLGCNAVMYDGSHTGFLDNVQKSKHISNLAHKCGVSVEGEVGIVAGMQHYDDNVEDINHLTSVSEAKAYVERTDVDCLAIAVGNKHGRQESKVKLDFKRLSRINKSVNRPLVIHGGSGLSDDQYHKLIEHGVAKINYFTALAERACKQVKSNIKQKEDNYWKVFAKVRQQVNQEAQRCMQVWGSAGRAAEVLLQCQPWYNVEHIIAFNANTEDKTHLHHILGRIRQALAHIPGVMGVELGQSVNDNDHVSYCWLVKLASESVVTNYISEMKMMKFGLPQGEFRIMTIVTGDDEMQIAGDTGNHANRDNINLNN